jgi:hypothetical protein
LFASFGADGIGGCVTHFNVLKFAEPGVLLFMQAFCDGEL